MLDAITCFVDCCKKYVSCLASSTILVGVSQTFLYLFACMCVPSRVNNNFCIGVSDTA